MIDLILTAYSIYLPITIGLTTFVSGTLFKNSKIFMLDIFHQQEDIANATNKLFKIGFYLLNIGFALIFIKIEALEDYKDLVEVLSSKIGGFSIYLGFVMVVFIIFFLTARKASGIKSGITVLITVLVLLYFSKYLPDLFQIFI